MACFDLAELAVERVVLAIAHYRIVQHVIAVIVRADLLDELRVTARGGGHDRVIHRRACSSSGNPIASACVGLVQARRRAALSPKNSPGTANTPVSCTARSSSTRRS